MVYDVTDMSSFLEIRTVWMEFIREVCLFKLLIIGPLGIRKANEFMLLIYTQHEGCTANTYSPDRHVITVLQPGYEHFLEKFGGRN